jgi:release factor H-coupled RctB family protein
MNGPNVDMNTKKISIFASSETWIEGESILQLERVASLNGMVRVVGFPDLHPGKGSPVGAAMVSEGEFYPYLIGSDLGCGMSLFTTEIPAVKAKPEKWFRKLKDLDKPWDGDASEWLEARCVQPAFEAAAGTIGHGNHFAELLCIHEIHDQEAFSELSLGKEMLFLIVHSGSRGLGDSLLREHMDRFRNGSLKAGSKESFAYLAQHDNALSWAHANRELIAYRLLEQLDSSYRMVVSHCHNAILPLGIEDPGRFLHRKGAAPSDHGVVVIAGSCGSYSYLVKPTGEQERNLWSVAHGAGRKWKRSGCKGRLRDRYTAASFNRTKLGSFVICEDKNRLYEEAPQAYKNIGTIIQDMVSLGLISVVASFMPVLTYKGRQQ